VRHDENLPVYQAFNGEFRDGSRGRGRPKNSWKEAVDTDSAKYGLQNWQKEALIRPKFKNFLDSVKARTRAVVPAK
jgi:hypothetical protein